MPIAQNGAVKVFYDTYGQGTPIVFLHPWSTNGYIWYYQVFSFARTNQVIVIDHRGHGRSDKPAGGYSIQEHASDVRAVMDAAGAQKAIIVGNSIGGMMAMQFALSYPDRVKGLLILSSGTALGENMPKETAAAFQSDYLGTFGALMEGAVSAKSKRERPEILDVMRAHFAVQSNFPKHVFDSSLADPNGVFNWNIKSRLASIKAPTLVVAGEEDQATPVEANKYLADNIPGAKLLTVKDVGHFHQLEKPLEFNATLKEFVTGLG
ncbi:MAG TPA: alpha/beta fold hydrolase [Candidatus Binataceae bacterium]|nr:alpha/beta fold hydrolase [Candidatus Binataceae bacterium]